MSINERQRINSLFLKTLLRAVHQVACLQMDLFQFWLVAAMFVCINRKCSQNYTIKIVFLFLLIFQAVFSEPQNIILLFRKCVCITLLLYVYAF